MRTWRVGTISMGISLLFLGVFLLLSQFAGFNMSQILISWWPIILIVLGVEILAYLYVSRKEKPFLKYDLLSIFFIGIIGSAGILFALLSSTGVLGAIEKSFVKEMRTFDLPVYKETVGETIKRVVLHTNEYPVTVEAASGREVSVFGIYTAIMDEKGKKPVEQVNDYLHSEKNGDTLYLQIKQLPKETTFISDHVAELNATVLVPENVKLEITGDWSPLQLKPRGLANDWFVEKGEHISLVLEDDSDIHVTASNVEGLTGNGVKWNIQEDSSGTLEEGHDAAVETIRKLSGSFKAGEGTHTIHIGDSFEVNVKTSSN